jgi:hypothetical protein
MAASKKTKANADRPTKLDNILIRCKCCDELLVVGMVCKCANKAYVKRTPTAIEYGANDFQLLEKLADCNDTAQDIEKLMESNRRRLQREKEKAEKRQLEAEQERTETLAAENFVTLNEDNEEDAEEATE